MFLTPVEHLDLRLSLPLSRETLTKRMPKLDHVADILSVYQSYYPTKSIA